MKSKALLRLLLLFPLAAAPTRAQTTRVLVVERPDAAPSAAVKTLREGDGFLVRRAAANRLQEEDVGWADAVILLAALEEGPSGRLGTAVRGGKGLVVAAGAATALEDSRSYDALLGRSARDGAPAAEASRPELAVAVLEQRHPVTQCVTHFRYTSRLVLVGPDRHARVLAKAMPAAHPKPATVELTPVMWEHRHGRGRVFVTTLELVPGPSADLLAAVLARAAQWNAGHRVTVHLPDSARWVAKTLGPKDTGLVPGRPPLEGFYRGRQKAAFMSYLGAGWLSRPERVKEEQPDRVIRSLGLEPGQTVADVGAGNGYFALRIARVVGQEGRVLAVDIQREMLELLKAEAAKQGVDNVVPIHATATDPKLPEDSVDLALMVDVYHELSAPAEVIAAVRKGLKKDGRLVLVEYRGEDPAVMIKPLHRMTVEQAKAELDALGFYLADFKKFLPVQHILVFKKKTARGRGPAREKPPRERRRSP